MIKYEIWQTGIGETLYTGHDPEEAILYGLKLRKKGATTEVLRREDGYTKRMAQWRD